MSGTHEKCSVSPDAWLLALRLRGGARARALAEPRHIPESIRGVESAMACGFIVLLQPSRNSYEILQSESDDFALAAQLLSLLHGAAERNLRCRRLIEFLSR